MEPASKRRSASAQQVYGFQRGIGERWGKWRAADESAAALENFLTQLARPEDCPAENPKRLAERDALNNAAAADVFELDGSFAGPPQNTGAVGVVNEYPGIRRQAFQISFQWGCGAVMRKHAISKCNRAAALSAARNGTGKFMRITVFEFDDRTSQLLGGIQKGGVGAVIDDYVRKISRERLGGDDACEIAVGNEKGIGGTEKCRELAFEHFINWMMAGGEA